MYSASTQKEMNTISEGFGLCGTVKDGGRERVGLTYSSASLTCSLGKNVSGCKKKESGLENNRGHCREFWVSYLNCIPAGLPDIHLLTWRINSRVHILPG